MTKFSIIICKYNEQLFNNCIRSIEETVFSKDYELIIIDNTENQYDLFQAYNEGIRRSSGEILCFMHEDIILLEKDWISRSIEHFKKDSELGMIGVAGGSSFSIFPLYWGGTYYPDNSRSNLTTKKGLERRSNDKTNQPTSNLLQALIVDGLWFCVRKSLFEEHNIRFDTENFQGFHRYDYDICFQIAQHAKIVVVDDVEIQHFSSGSRNKQWLQASLDFQNKWKDLLPSKVEPGQIGIKAIPKGDRDLIALIYLVLKMKHMGFSSNEIHSVIAQNRLTEIRKDLSFINRIKLVVLPFILFIPSAVLGLFKGKVVLKVKNE